MMTFLSIFILISLTAKPQILLNADVRDIPVGGSVTLICSVNPSSGWKYYWYRDEKLSHPLTSKDAVFHSNGQISVSEGGLYRCRGGRGNPVYYTEYSDPVTINTIVVLVKSLGEVSGYLGDTITLKSGVNPAWNLSKIEWSVWSNHTWIATYRKGRTNTERVHQFEQRLTLDTYSGDLTIRNLIRDDAMEYTVDLLNTHDEEKVNKINLIVRERLQKPTIQAASQAIQGECLMVLNCSSPDDGVNYSWDVEPSSVYTSDKSSARLLAIFTQNSVNFTCTTNNNIDHASSVVTLECDESSSEKSSFPALLITGLVCGVLLILILLPLLVCCCRKMKDPHCGRFSQSLYVNQGSAVHQPETQNETQVYSSLLYGDASVYESIRGSGNTDSGGTVSE